MPANDTLEWIDKFEYKNSLGKGFHGAFVTENYDKDCQLLMGFMIFE